MELAEEKSLLFDETTARDSIAVLINPRKRLAAEISWFPGLSPKRISEVISIVEQNPAKVRSLDNLPSIAHANLLAEGLVRVIEQLPQQDAARWIVQLAEVYDDVEVEQTVNLLNEDRSVAGLPTISNFHDVETELQTRRQYYQQALKDALDKVSSSLLVEIVTMTVDIATEDGNQQAPILIDDLVDKFEAEAQEFLEKEKENIEDLIKAVRNRASREENHNVIAHLVTQLEIVVKNWDKIAQPIQVSARSRGISHRQSHDVAKKIRDLAVELFNKHDLLEFSKQLTALQQEVFAEVDRVVEQLEEDSIALDRIAKKRAQLLSKKKARAESWIREITYEADVGTISKNKLRISPDGIQWKGILIRLEDISRVRWGGTRHSVNDIPTGTTFHIFVGSNEEILTINLKKHQIYSEFIDRLWKTAGMRLLTKMLEDLRDGKRYRFGTAIVTDHGVEFERHRLFFAHERVPCKWKDLVIGSVDGNFYITKGDEKKVTVKLPYQEMDNVHILEIAMRTFFKKKALRISDLLNYFN